MTSRRWSLAPLLAILVLLISLTPLGPLSPAGPGEARAAKTFTVKLATLAPDGTAWHKALMRMGSEWQRATQGRVRLRIYPGSVAGDDPDMVRKIRIGQLHAGALTVGGLSLIDTAFNVFSIPMFYDSYEELLYVRDGLAPILEKRLQEKGFILLQWGYGGWVHLFSTKPVHSVEDLRHVKVFTWAGDDRMTRVWQSNGYHPVPLAVTDILVGLQTGLINGVPTTPYAALSMQWFRHTPYMMELGVAPLVGGTVIAERAWKRISKTDQSALLQAARQADLQLRDVIPRSDDEAVQAMLKRGLTVVKVQGEEEVNAWRATAHTFAEDMRELGMIPDDIYQQALQLRTSFRTQRRAEATP